MILFLIRIECDSWSIANALLRKADFMYYKIEEYLVDSRLAASSQFTAAVFRLAVRRECFLIEYSTLHLEVQILYQIRTSKFSRTPERVEITIADISSKVDLLKWLIVDRFASINFCSSLMLVIES